MRILCRSTSPATALIALAFGAFGCAGGVDPIQGGVASDGGVGGVRCSVDADCKNSDPCMRNVCANNGICVPLPRDRDGDGRGDLACGGDDCNDLDPRANPLKHEDCTDGVDNDCNGVADCNDPACPADSCGCIPQASTEVCDDGVDNDCDGLLDCFDSECIGTPPCGCVDEVCGNGIDDDCDGSTDCDSPACAKTIECSCGLSAEICFGDGEKDEDCDGLINCADPDCVATGICGCIPPPRPEDCGRFGDEDCDGLVNCADPDCRTYAACAHCTTEICSNGKDDDCDGRIDCADSACRLDPLCAPADELCQNSVDDDYDGAIDCSDSDCASNPTCLARHSTCQSPLIIRSSGSYVGDTTGFVGETKSTHCGGAGGEAVFRLVLAVPAGVSLDTIGSSFDTTLYVRLGNCSSGRELACDDDSGDAALSAKLTFDVLPPGDYFIFVDGFQALTQGGFGDNARPSLPQGPYVLNVDLAFNPAEVCGNGKDDDGDRFADCADPDCASADSCKGCDQPKPEFGIAACTNGKDDDCDGDIDCADDDCSANPDYPTECCDGINQNGNGSLDDFACRCASASDCPSEICYTHSMGACGPSCFDLEEDICGLFVPGSKCSATTHQCEF